MTPKTENPKNHAKKIVVGPLFFSLGIIGGRGVTTLNCNGVQSSMTFDHLQLEGLFLWATCPFAQKKLLLELDFVRWGALEIQI